MRGEIGSEFGWGAGIESQSMAGFECRASEDLSTEAGAPEEENVVLLRHWGVGELWNYGKMRVWIPTVCDVWWGCLLVGEMVMTH